MMVQRVLVSLLVVLLGCSHVEADLFDRIVDDMFTNQRQRRLMYTKGGRSMQGGAVVRFPVTISNQADKFKISTPCGSWSLTPQGVLGNLKEMLDPDRLKAALMSAIQDSIQNLIGAVVSKLSMLTVCYAVPTLCDLTKHMQAVAGQLHNVRSLSCQQLEGMVNSVGTSLTAGRTSRCIQGQISQGMSLNVAQRICASGEWSPAPTNPGADGGWGLFGDGGGSTPGGSAFADAPMSDDPANPTVGLDSPAQRTKQQIIRDTLKTALADSSIPPGEQQQLLDFQEHIIGDLSILDSSDPDSNTPAADQPGDDEPASTELQPKMPEYKLHDFYKSEFGRMDAALECAIDTFGSHRDMTSDPTATCSQVDYMTIDNTAANTPVPDSIALLKMLSIPGMEVPVSGLQGLYEMKGLGEVDKYVMFKGKISGSLALMRTVWMTRQIRDELETGMMGKEDQTEEERKQIEIRLRRLEREAERMIESRDTAERFMIPTFQAIIQDREIRRARIARQVLGAGERTDRGGTFGGAWNPFGYSLD